MTGDVIIGLDAGTSVIKAVAFTPDGGQIETAALGTDAVRMIVTRRRAGR